MTLVCHILGRFPGEICNQPWYTVVREWPNKGGATPGWQVAGLMSRGTYIRGLSWAPAIQSLCTCLQNLKGFCRSFKRVQSHAPSRGSRQHITTSGLCPGCIFWEERGQAGCTLLAWYERPLIAWVLLTGQLESRPLHELPDTPPLQTCSYNLTHSRLLRAPWVVSKGCQEHGSGPPDAFTFHFSFLPTCSCRW